MLTIAGGIILALVILYVGGWLLLALISFFFRGNDSKTSRPIQFHNPRHNRRPMSPEEREFRETLPGLFNMRGR